MAPVTTLPLCRGRGRRESWEQQRTNASQGDPRAISENGQHASASQWQLPGKCPDPAQPPGQRERGQKLLGGLQGDDPAVSPSVFAKGKALCKERYWIIVWLLTVPLIPVVGEVRSSANTRSSLLISPHDPQFLSAVPSPLAQGWRERPLTRPLRQQDRLCWPGPCSEPTLCSESPQERDINGDMSGVSVSRSHETSTISICDNVG